MTRPTPPLCFPVTRALPLRRLPLVARRPGSRAARLPRGAHPGRRLPRRRAAISRRRPGPAGRHPLPSRRAFAAAAGRAGIDARHVRGRLRLARRRRAAVVAAAALRPRRLRRARPRRLARAAARPATSTPSRPTFEPRPSAPATRSTARSSPRRLGELVVVDARLPRRWRGEPNPVDRVPGRIPGAVNAPWNEPRAGAARRRARRLLRLGRHGVRRRCTASTSPAARAASTPAPGRSGSSTRSCRSSARA